MHNNHRDPMPPTMELRQIALCGQVKDANMTPSFFSMSPDTQPFFIGTGRD
jgi:hypothetical protein